MRTHQALNGRADVIVPGDHLLGGPETDELVDIAKQLTAQGRHALLIDFHKVNQINSLALGALTRIVIAYAKVNGKVKVCNLGSRVRGLFDIVLFNKLFEYYESEDTALEAFGREMAELV
ncbi:MAG: STAS domain-containing protein [Candidatus Eisenbacteria bacterium]